VRERNAVQEPGNTLWLAVVGADVCGCVCDHGCCSDCCGSGLLLTLFAQDLHKKDKEDMRKRLMQSPASPATPSTEAGNFFDSLLIAVDGSTAIAGSIGGGVAPRYWIARACSCFTHSLL
jgi:hypothetical protein